MAQSQLAAVLGAIPPRNTEFDLWPMKFGITPTLSTGIDAISHDHIKALLFELNWIKVNTKTHTLVTATRDAFNKSIAICLANYDVDFQDFVNHKQFKSKAKHKQNEYNFLVHTKDIQKQTGSARKRRRGNKTEITLKHPDNIKDGVTEDIIRLSERKSKV